MKRAFLLGEHVAHSLSPAIHNAAFAALGLDAEYGLLDVPPAGLPAALARLREADCFGANVTMPYKTDVLAAADECAESVRRCGAASLLVNRHGRLTAHNNDVEAISACLARRAGTVARGPAVILGAGGSAAAMLEAMRRVPPARAVVLARRPEAASALAARARERVPFPVEAGPLGDVARALAGATLVLNATNLGVGEADPSPVPAAALRPGLLVYDVVYRREGPTRLQADALAAGALVCDGLAHLFEQAPFTFRLLTGHEPPRAVMLESLVAATGRPPLDWGPEPEAGGRA
jgi:shikimate dehydrogenase